MQQYTILWADDEIDLLKPHILFLQNKGFKVTGVNSGADALDLIESTPFDIVFLDENMPGLSGLETLAQLKTIKPNLPVVMITKSEEENIMEDAIGAKISDYLIKPLNPNQILLSVKKILDGKALISETTTRGYQEDFRNISMAYSERIDHLEWTEIYKKLVFWELEMQRTKNSSMATVLEMQKDEANTNFGKFINEEYKYWLNDPKADRPTMSHEIMKKKVFPLLQPGRPVYFILIDNLRYDQWKTIELLLSDLFTVEKEETYFSILPTTTAYARNAIFSGLMPSDIAKQYPQFWKNDDDDDGKNLHEHELLTKQVERNRLNIKTSYHKILHTDKGQELANNMNKLKTNDLNVIVYNFMDMLSHARTDSEMLKELAPDEAAYRSLTYSWFEHSPLFLMMQEIAKQKGKLVITTDHGTIRVNKTLRIVGDRNVNSNLRYKQGKNLGFDEKEVMVSHRPEDIKLPAPNVSTSYVFAWKDGYFVYPNNYNHFANMFRNTFQHGGISLEEMIIPFITLEPK